jgi:hypothetical protein
LFIYSTQHRVLQTLEGIFLEILFCVYIFPLEYTKTIILPVVLYGCKTCSLTLREKHRLRMFENRVLRRIFGPKRDEMIGGG